MQSTFSDNDRKRELRAALGRFPTGVAIVTAVSESKQPVGMTINSLTSISLAPALLAWSIDQRSASHDIFASAESFTVTVLTETQADLAIRFATRGADKFGGLDIDPRSAPVIPNGCAWFKCNAYRSIELGDHTMLVGRVIEFESRPLEPLVFIGGQFQRSGQHANTSVQVAA